MIIIMRPDATPEQIAAVVEPRGNRRFTTHLSEAGNGQ